jgi:putative restriction endonuclease
VLAKMANLDGSRSHGARWDVLAGAILRDDPARFTTSYRLLLHAARAKGISPDRLPDLFGLEYGGELALLGQDELDLSVLVAELRDQIRQHHDTSALPDLETDSPARSWPTAAAAACSAACDPPPSAQPGCCWPATSNPGRTALRPNGSTPQRPGRLPRPRRRLRHGMLTINGGLRIHLAGRLADGIQADPAGPPVLRQATLARSDPPPQGAQPPARKYLDWHRDKVFIA